MGRKGDTACILQATSYCAPGMETLTHITHDPNVMGGKPCIRGLRVTVGTVVGLVASGHSPSDIVRLYPYLTPDDVREALAYAAWRVEEIEVPLAVA